METTSQQHDEHKPMRHDTVVVHGGSATAYVSIRDGVTLNMLDYNSFRRDIGVELPVPLGRVEEVLDMDGNLMPEVRAHLDRVYNALDGWVAEKHERTVQDATEYFGGE